MQHVHLNRRKEVKYLLTQGAFVHIFLRPLLFQIALLTFLLLCNLLECLLERATVFPYLNCCPSDRLRTRTIFHVMLL